MALSSFAFGSDLPPYLHVLHENRLAAPTNKKYGDDVRGVCSRPPTFLNVFLNQIVFNYRWLFLESITDNPFRFISDRESVQVV